MKRKRKLTLLLFASMLLTLLLGITASAASGTVATIGSKKYTSLESAIKDVKNGGTIVLKKNVTYTKPLTISRSGKKFTINLNKKIITFKNEKSYLNVKKGTVTLKNGTLVQKADKACIIKTQKGAGLTISSGTYKGLISNAGTMSITGGTFTNIGTKTDLNNATISNKGTMTIKGGTVNGKKKQAIANSGTLKITGGTFTTSIPLGEGLEDPNVPEQQPDTLIYNYSKGNLTISGGKFTSTVLILLNTEKAAVTVSNGKASFTSESVGCLTNFGTATIKGGIWTEKGEKWAGGVFYDWDTGTMTVSNVTAKSNWSVLETYGGVITVKSGTFTSTCNGDPAMLLAFGGKIQVTGGTFTGKKTWGCWKDDAGTIKISSAVKMNVKEVNKTGELFQ